MNRKAFTLVELLAVIAVLAVVMVIAIPSVQNSLVASYKKAYILDLKSLQSAAKEYIIRKSIKIENGSQKIITISQMISSNIIDEIKDPKTKEICDGYIIVTKNGNKYVYSPYLKCGENYLSDDYGNTNTSLPIIKIIGSNPVGINLGNSYIDAGATAVDYQNNNITSKIVTTSSVNITLPGTYNITYSVKDDIGNESIAKRTVKVIDNTIPTITFNPNGNTTYAKSGNVVIKASDIGGLDDSNLKYVWSTSTTQPATTDFASLYKSNEAIKTPSDISGVYYLWAMASDIQGNKSVKSSGKFYLDNIRPVITLNGSNPTIVNRKATYVDAGAIVTDNVDGSVSITSSGTVNPNVVGTYTITYKATDSCGNTGIAVRTVKVIDTEAPVITLNGNNPTNINVGGIYADAGATAIDDVDGNITSKIITTGTVNPSVVGTYTITYTVKDNAGNTTTAKRTVNVIDNVLPTVTFGANGNTTYAKSRSTTINVSDAHTGVNTSSLKYLWNTSTAVPNETSFITTFTNGGTVTTPAGVTGGYYLWIFAKDNAGNKLIARTNVFNLDNTKPVITLNGNATVTVNKGSTYADAGATATDSNSGINGSVTSTGTVNPSIVGTYKITYTVSDKAGNTTTSTRTINVIDVLAPVITLNGSNPITIEINSTYADAGATATDDVDGNVTSKISVSSNVNPSIKGTYTVTYTVKDNAGNMATSTRTVNVVDTNAPTILLASAGTMIYTDPTFASGTNSTNIYNNTGNGTVSINRVAISGSPVGSGYGLEIKTTGTPSPGWGGFYFATQTSANKTYITRIVAKIPVGYNINWASNAYGSDGSFTWLTSQAGTGTWQEYICQVKAGTTGSFSSTNFYYLTGGTTPTSSSPLTWYVAYATVFDTTSWGTSNSVVFASSDKGTGITGYGINQSSTTVPSFTTITSSKEIGKTIDNITTNGTYYLWVKDGSGNTSNKAVTVNYVDRTGPTIATATAGTMLYTDPTFASGTNSTNIYNNAGNGTVSINRVAISGSPVGSGYGLEIKTTGTPSPGWGGFSFATQTSANKTYITRIVAKIPVGYNINWTSNSFGSGGSFTWLTSQAGTGTWQEYICQVKAGTTGTFSTTNYYYLTGGTTPTSSSPLTWYVAYATVFDTTRLGTRNSVVFTSSDNNSGVTGYGINQSSTTAPSFTSVTNTNSLNTSFDNITSNGTYYLWLKDALGNTSNKSFVVNYVDTTAPTISTSLTNHQLSNFSNWTMAGVAYINGGGQLVLPTTGNSIAYSPYIPVSGSYWNFKMNGLTTNQSVNNAPYGSVFIGSSYYDVNYVSATSSNGYSGNGYAPSLPLNTTTTFSWDGWAGNGANVYYVTLVANADGGYGVAPITLSNFSFFTSGGMSNYSKIINVTASDANGIKVTKWLTGAKSAADFTSAGTLFTSSFEVINNGTYTIYAEDNAGNKTVYQQVINDIDRNIPTVTFGTNGNSTYAKSRSTTVTVNDSQSGVNTINLKYLWTTSTTAPLESSFTTSFTNGGTISSPSGVTGSYYLWILAKDKLTNRAITRSNVFNLDNTAPVITISGSNPVTINKGSTYADAGATAYDSIFGNVGVSSSSNVNTSIAGTYYVTYTAADGAGNITTPVKRTVIVKETYVTCNSSNSLDSNSTYNSTCSKGSYYTACSCSGPLCSGDCCDEYNPTTIYGSYQDLTGYSSPSNEGKTKCESNCPTACTYYQYYIGGQSSCWVYYRWYCPVGMPK